MRSAVKVSVRIRPPRTDPLCQESSRKNLLVPLNEKELQIEHQHGTKLPLLFNFQHVFTSEHSQEVVFESVGRGVISKIMKGEHVCLFAYGQTSSGKTFSMFGDPNAPGLVPRLGNELFESVSAKEGSQRIEVKVSSLVCTMSPFL